MSQTQGTLHISPINPAVTYHIPVSVHGYTCSFLVDTGAAVTLINSLTWTHCKLSGQSLADLIPWNQQRLVGVDGYNELVVDQCYGCCTLRYKPPSK